MELFFKMASFFFHSMDSVCVYDCRPGKECNSSYGDSRMLYVYYVAYHHPNLHDQDRHGLDETSVCVCESISKIP